MSLPRDFTTTTLGKVFCFSAHRENSFKLIIMINSFLGTSRVWLLNLFFVLFILGSCAMVEYFYSLLFIIELIVPRLSSI